jgi:DNA invertase Pin-like site-specific DNA recombinase
MNMTTAIYLRVSTDMQETSSQRFALDDYCKRNGYKDVTYYEDDGISGKTLNRPAIQKLMLDVEAGVVSRVVVFEVSRLSRNLMDSLLVLKSLEERGVVVETPEGVQRFSSSQDQFLALAKAFVASQERERISARVKAGLARVKGMGIKLGAPVGNQRRAGKVKSYDPAVVDKAKRLRDKGCSLQEISSFISVPLSTVRRILLREVATV